MGVPPGKSDSPETQAPLSSSLYSSSDKMEGEVQACFDAGNSFNTKLRDTLAGLLNANNDRKAEIDGLRTDVDKLRSDHDALEVTTTRENDLRKNEVKAVDDWAKGENSARKSEIEALKNFAETENEARKTGIANIDNFARTENDGRKADIAALTSRLDSENAARTAEDQALSDRLNKEVSEREQAIADLQARSDGQNDDRIADIGDLKTKMLKENAYLKTLASKTLGVSFNAYRTKAYDGGGEENPTFQGTYTNIGGGLDIDTGIFTCPVGGTYIFQFHIATHDNKKALLSIRKNGEEIASIFDQNHKDNHKNSMAGQNIILDVKKGDEIVVYAYTGTWLADFPMNHYTHWVGLLLKPSQ